MLISRRPAAEGSWWHECLFWTPRLWSGAHHQRRITVADIAEREFVLGELLGELLAREHPLQLDQQRGTAGKFDALVFGRTADLWTYVGAAVVIAGTTSVSYTHLTLPTNREV